MYGNRFRVPLAICYADDMHFLRRRLIPIFDYLQDVLHCWKTQRDVNRFLAERTILKEIKCAGILEGISRLSDLRRLLLKHERLASSPKIVSGERRIQKARKVKDPTHRLDPTVKVLAVIGGALMPCKGNHFRRRYAYREGADYGASIAEVVFLPKQPFAHYSEQHTLADKTSTFSGDNSCDSIRNSLKILKREDWCDSRHVMPNV